MTVIAIYVTFAIIISFVIHLGFNSNFIDPDAQKEPSELQELISGD